MSVYREDTRLPIEVTRSAVASAHRLTDDEIINEYNPIVERMIAGVSFKPLYYKASLKVKAAVDQIMVEIDAWRNSLL